jgi:hypothetical protein
MHSPDWQTPSALAVVALTVVAFIWRSVRKRRSKKSGSSCGSGCACAPKIK